MALVVDLVLGGMSEKEVGVNDRNSEVCGLGSKVLLVLCPKTGKREYSIFDLS